MQLPLNWHSQNHFKLSYFGFPFVLIIVKDNGLLTPVIGLNTTNVLCGEERVKVLNLSNVNWEEENRFERHPV